MTSTEILLENAEASLNIAQNERWIEQTDLAKLLMLDAQTRSLIAIAQEFKRFNDNTEKYFQSEE